LAGRRVLTTGEADLTHFIARFARIPTTISLSIAISLAFVAAAEPTPDWAIPKQGEASAKPSSAKLTVPGSALELTQEQIDDPYNAPDWFPDSHAPMPEIVKHGRKPAIQACAMCHLASGNGHPQSAKLAGLSVQKFLDQLAAFKVGDRHSFLGAFIDDLHRIPADEDALAAARWFASLPPTPHQRVIETDAVPETHFGARFMRFVKEGPDGTVKQEPINGRIVEVPEDADAVKSRDPRAIFLTYVPKGSLARGAEIATSGVGAVPTCVSCHGPDLRGTGLGSALAGAFPTYIVRQLYDFRNGKRKGLADKTGVMSVIARQMSPEDIVNVAAYIGSLAP
jgi:cytochrome c553